MDDDTPAMHADAKLLAMHPLAMTLVWVGWGGEGMGVRVYVCCVC